MNQKSTMPIREFARLTGIRPANLRFYDQIGLLSPELRGENGYRYYSRRQLSTAYLISVLRDLGVGLEEIKRYAGERSPQQMLALFGEQDKRIQAEMNRLRAMRELMRLRADMEAEALRHEDGTLLLAEKEREPIFLGPPLERGTPEDDGLLQTYEAAAGQGVNLSFPLGAVMARQAMETADLSDVARYYFKVRRGHNAYKPAGTYAVAYGRCAMGQSDDYYERLLRFIRDRGLGIAGDAYEEYLLDELSVQDETRYMVHLEVPVTAER